jgi:hypothetical protein
VRTFVTTRAVQSVLVELETWRRSHRESAHSRQVVSHAFASNTSLVQAAAVAWSAVRRSASTSDERVARCALAECVALWLHWRHEAASALVPAHTDADALCDATLTRALDALRASRVLGVHWQLQPTHYTLVGDDNDDDNVSSDASSGDSARRVTSTHRRQRRRRHADVHDSSRKRRRTKSADLHGDGAGDTGGVWAFTQRSRTFEFGRAEMLDQILQHLQHEFLCDRRSHR